MDLHCKQSAQKESTQALLEAPDGAYPIDFSSIFRAGQAPGTFMPVGTVRRHFARAWRQDCVAQFHRVENFQAGSRISEVLSQYTRSGSIRFLDERAWPHIPVIMSKLQAAPA